MVQWSGGNQRQGRPSPLRGVLEAIQAKAQPWIDRQPEFARAPYRSAVRSGSEMLPGVGDLVGLEDLEAATRSGDAVGMGLGLLGAVPGIPAVGGAARRGGRAARRGMGLMADSADSAPVGLMGAQPAYRVESSQDLAPTDTPESLRAQGYEIDPQTNTWARVVAQEPTPAGLAPVKVYHGSPQAGLTSIRRGERGPFGPAAYLTPYDSVAKRYGENLYETEVADIFDGIGRHPSSVNPYEVWRNQNAKLVEAVPPESREAVSALAAQMQPQDGYGFFRRFSQIMGGDAAAQDAMRAAGFRGVSGWVDGPEVAMFDDVPLATPEPSYPIRAYHGSPHSFDRFSMDAIGTGEGNQAFGRGLYFAQNEAVAKQYADEVKYMVPVQNINARLSELAAEMRPLEISYGKYREPRGYELKSEYDRLMDERSALSQAPGNMYEVGINADPNAFIDYDAPLSQQSEQVRRLLGYQEAPAVPPPSDPELMDIIQNALKQADGDATQVGLMVDNDGALYQRALAHAQRQGVDVEDAGSYVEEQARDYLESLLPNEVSGDALMALYRGRERELYEAGVPGVRYRDNFSRSGEQDARTHNYVVFSDELIKVLRKYGISGLGIGTGTAIGAGAMQDDGGGSGL